MFERKSVAVVVPCYNEQEQIASVLAGIPDYVDCVIVVDDASTDETYRRVEQFALSDARVVLLRRPHNAGPGAAVADGFRECMRRRIDIACVMDGDGQMDPEQLVWLVSPVARGLTDYAKANRLIHSDAWKVIPKVRYFGNAFLSMLTKIASGYWHVADSQSGFTAIRREALEMIELDGLYPGFGYPNDMLVRLNVFGFRVLDVPLRPRYGVGERSKLSVSRVMSRIGWLVVTRFLWRIWRKYVVYDFHPLVLFYTASAIATLGAAGLLTRLIWMWAATGRIPAINALAWLFCLISSTQFGLFAMWFDMDTNRHLRVVLPVSQDVPFAVQEEAPVTKTSHDTPKYP